MMIKICFSFMGRLINVLVSLYLLQNMVKQLISQTEGLVHGVNHHNMFSAYEELAEIPAEHIRYHQINELPLFGGS